MDAPAIRVGRTGEIATITLDRPDQRNALALGVMRELTEAFGAIGRSDALAVVLAAEGPVFSAGHNFGDLAGADLDTAREVFEVCTEMMDTIQRIPQPVIAQVHALATAAGCQLVASCDLAVAAESAAFALPGGRGGLFCHTPLVAVARNIGRKRALEMALSGDPIDAHTAAEWGLINRVVPDDRLGEAVLELARRVTRGAPDSKAAGKHGFYAQVDLDQTAAYRAMIELMAASVISPDAQEGIDAFLAKRPATFRPPAWPRGSD